MADGRDGDGGRGHSQTSGIDSRALPMTSASMHHQAAWPSMQNGGPQPMHASWAPHTGYPVAQYHIADQQRYSYGPPPISIPHQSDVPGSPQPPAGEGDDDEDGDSAGPNSPRLQSGGPSGRALKQTRRAEQNRQAQRAFRQRKELYIAELEKRSAELSDLQAAWTSQEGRRMEVEERARTLAERALALDARERSLPIHFSHAALSAPIPEDMNEMRQEIETLRVQVAHREESSRSLRLALEDVSSENKALRIQLREQGIQIE